VWAWPELMGWGPDDRWVPAAGGRWAVGGHRISGGLRGVLGDDHG
jgi:hypothetical protein